MERFDYTIAKLIDKLGDAGFENVPYVIELAVQSVWWEGITQLVYMGMSFGIGIFGVFIYQYGRQNKNDFHRLAGGSFFIGMTLLGLILATSDNPWLKVFNPEVGLINELFSCKSAWGV